ncbi:MAG: hypothetical protein QXP36_12240, partial [Conexivisphaerales archaeon]
MVDEPEPSPKGIKSKKNYVKIDGKYVRCSECHRKIAFNNLTAKNGLYLHIECFREKGSPRDYEKRYAIKAIGFGSAIAGAYLLGAERFASAVIPPSPSGGGIGEYKKNAFVLPGLYSDPLNPLPGQMWYRMDAGVTAFRDEIAGRNVYSKRHSSHITVSSKGIINGLSRIPNDGADFGPDTTYGTSLPGKTGPPYTQTSGIQEAWNYAIATASDNFSNESSVKLGWYWMKPILLLEGIFTLQQKVFISPDKPIANIKMLGQGTMGTYVYWNFNDNAIEIDHTNGNIKYVNFEIGYMQPQAGSNVGNDTAFFAANYVSTDPSYQTNVFQSYDMDFSNSFGGRAMFSLQGFQQVYLINAQAYNGGAYGTLYCTNTSTVELIGGNTGIGNYYENCSNVVEDLINYQGAAPTLVNVQNYYAPLLQWYNGPHINGNVNNMHIGILSANETSGPGSPFLQTDVTSSVIINNL